jgi:hypothetical protein
MVISVAELSWYELSNFAHPVIIHQPPPEPWTKMYCRAGDDISPEAWPRFPTKFVMAQFFMLGQGDVCRKIGLLAASLAHSLRTHPGMGNHFLPISFLATWASLLFPAQTVE